MSLAPAQPCPAGLGVHGVAVPILEEGGRCEASLAIYSADEISCDDGTDLAIDESVSVIGKFVKIFMTHSDLAQDCELLLSHPPTACAAKADRLLSSKRAYVHLNPIILLRSCTRLKNDPKPLEATGPSGWNPSFGPAASQ
ncbi:hypothetical protein [Agrobacterium radiobacter]|uniref:hypothetical protein n=1 Tax=Agrobacterium radiobacter TaxID=362 RepID=UPI003F82DC62